MIWFLRTMVTIFCLAAFYGMLALLTLLYLG